MASDTVPPNFGKNSGLSPKSRQTLAENINKASKVDLPPSTSTSPASKTASPASKTTSKASTPRIPGQFSPRRNPNDIIDPLAVEKFATDLLASLKYWVAWIWKIFCYLWLFLDIKMLVIVLMVTSFFWTTVRHQKLPYQFLVSRAKVEINRELETMMGDHTEFIAKAKRRFEVYGCANMPDDDICEGIWHTLIIRDVVPCRAAVVRLRDECFQSMEDRNSTLVAQWDEVLFDTFVAKPVGSWLVRVAEWTLGKKGEVLEGGLERWSSIEWLNGNLDKIPRKRYSYEKSRFGEGRRY